jgi:hypothetical protein
MYGYQFQSNVETENTQNWPKFPYLCVLDLERAATRINVRSIQGLLSTLGRLHIVKSCSLKEQSSYHPQASINMRTKPSEAQLLKWTITGKKERNN